MPAPSGENCLGFTHSARMIGTMRIAAHANRDLRDPSGHSHSHEARPRRCPTSRAAHIASSSTAAAGGSHTYGRTRIAALQGEPELAVQRLREALAQGYGNVYGIHLDMSLEPLRDYPPFQELLRPKG